MPVNTSEQNFFKLLATQAKENPNTKPISEMTLEEFRAGVSAMLKYAGKPFAIEFKDTFMPARDGYQIPVRIYNPNTNKTEPVFIWYPVNGYILDFYEVNTVICSRLAKFLGIKVIIPNIRLAPEHPLPIPIYDGYDVTHYISANAKQLGIDPNKIFIGGASSGGNCAAVISSLVRKTHDFKIHHQILLNGLFDISQSNHDYESYEKQDLISTKEQANFIYSHFGIKQKDYKNPLFSPYYETDLTGLPPTTIIVGEYDGIRSNSEAYYKKLKAAGHKVEKILLPGQTHTTIVYRGVMTDGEDPAKVIANVIKRDLNNK